MKLRLTLSSLTLSILLLAPTVAAQAPQTAKQSDEEKAKARKELEKRALALLDETLQGAQALKLAENRAALRAQAADLLWTRDEKRARALFREAATDIVAASPTQTRCESAAGCSRTCARNYSTPWPRATRSSRSNSCASHGPAAGGGLPSMYCDPNRN